MKFVCFENIELSPVEFLIKSFLIRLNVKFHREVHFDNCISSTGAKMRYDFYVPKSSVLIEYDGLDFHASDDQKLRDNEKTNFAKRSGLKLYRLNKKHFPNLEKHLISILRQNKIVKNICVEKNMYVPIATPYVIEQKQPDKEYLAETYYKNNFEHVIEGVSAKDLLKQLADIGYTGKKILLLCNNTFLVGILKRYTFKSPEKELMNLFELVKKLRMTNSVTIDYKPKK